MKGPFKALPAILLGLTMTASAWASSTASAATTPRPTPPAGKPVPSGFAPGSVTFVSATTGFVIGVDSSCAAGSCVALARTTNRGSSWVLLSAPAAAYVARDAPSSATVPVVSEVRFADKLDGWIYGPSLFATHNGGASWRRVKLAGSVMSLETSGGYVDALVSPCVGEQVCTGPSILYQARATGGAFSAVLTGPSTSSAAEISYHLSLHAPVGFVDMSGPGALGQANFYATENLAKPTGWKPFPDPCAVAADHTVDAFVAPNTTSLETLCSGGAAAGSVQKEVVKTVNAISVVVGTPPLGGDPEELAATSSGTVVVSAASGASFLYRSTDDGATWTTAETFYDGGIGFNDLGFTTATQGIVIHGYPGPPLEHASQLLMTTDDGASWTVVPITSHRPHR